MPEVDDAPRCCSNCRFWLQDSRDLDDGKCRRRAPAAIPEIHIAVLNLLAHHVMERVPKAEYEEWLTDNLRRDIDWPTTGYEDWCGEWERSHG